MSYNKSNRKKLLNDKKKRKKDEIIILVGKFCFASNYIPNVHVVNRNK